MIRVRYSILGTLGLAISHSAKCTVSNAPHSYHAMCDSKTLKLCCMRLCNVHINRDMLFKRILTSQNYLLDFSIISYWYMVMWVCLGLFSWQQCTTSGASRERIPICVCIWLCTFRFNMTPIMLAACVVPRGKLDFFFMLLNHPDIDLTLKVQT